MADPQDVQDASDEEAPEEGAPRQEGWEEAVVASSFARCATCRNAAQIDLEAGTLLCCRFNMFVNAEADEIPDDCPEYEHDPSKPVPPDEIEGPATRPAAPDDVEPQAEAG